MNDLREIVGVTLILVVALMCLGFGVYELAIRRRLIYPGIVLIVLALALCGLAYSFSQASP